MSELSVGALQGSVTSADTQAKARGRLGVIWWMSVTWLAVVVALAVLAPVLPIPDPNETGFTCPRCAPLDGALLGGDSLGRDIFSRLLAGARVSLAVGFMSIGLGLVVGGSLGVIAGFFRGRLDGLIMTVMDALLAFPSLVLLLAIVSFIADNQPNILHVSLGIGLLSTAPVCRLVRANTLVFAGREFVIAARTVGATHRRIVWREILPNVLPTTLSFSLVGVAVAIVAEGGLAFLGLSVGAPNATWGGMINDGRLVLRDTAHVALIPSCAMFLTVLALNFVGDGLTARYAVREGSL